ncbi:hypothetical protein Goklo_020120, partial [Gossypium klotzschianum]|nr:hypothetical protein [Gossypium klotzschianum]
IPEESIKRIVSITPPHASAKPDKILNIDGVREVESGSTASDRGELCEILDGLNVLLSRRFDRVLIQTDSMEAMKAIQIFTKTSSKSALIRQIQQLLMK